MLSRDEGGGDEGGGGPGGGGGAGAVDLDGAGGDGAAAVQKCKKKPLDAQKRKIAELQEEVANLKAEKARGGQSSEYDETDHDDEVATEQILQLTEEIA